MIIRSLARRPNAIQCLALKTCRAARTTPFARNVHSVPTLQNHNELTSNGIPGLLSRKGFNTAYIEYQEHIVNELDFATAGSPWENSEPKSCIVDFARDPTKAYLFNVASMAYNNHFFFRGINTDPNVQSSPSSDIIPEINKHFTSLETFRETFLTTAEAMFGPGFVWLVQQNDTAQRPLRILTTYLAGSPLSGAHYRRQEHDLNTHNANTYQGLNKVGAFGASSKQENKPQKPLGGTDIIPLLCVNTWEHVWLHDYGVRGKRQYLEAWWDKIDWNAVRDLGTWSQSGPKMGEGHRKFEF